jgi:hypothetical protein
LSLEEFYKLYDIYARNREEVEKIEIKEEKVEEAFKDGPPCLNRLARDGFSEGSRNNALFNIAIFFKQSDPDTWQDEVVAANLKYMSKPLSNGEVQQLLKSIGKKGYDKYRCKLPPIVDVCNSSLCRTKKFGVGGNEEVMPKLGNLTKYNSNPPQYFLDIGEEETEEGKKQKRIELKAEQLASPALFSLAMLEKADLLVPKLKEKDWREFYLKPLVDNLQTVQPLESLDPQNQITALLQDWTTNRQNARTMDDVFNKLPYTDEKREFTYFRMEDFFNFCKKNHWEMDKAKTGNLIKQLKTIFIEEVRMKIKGQEPRLVKIKTMKKLDASVSAIKYQEQHF